LTRLGLPAELRRSLACTNIIEKPAPKQITFIDTLDRGVALVLVLSSGGIRCGCPTGRCGTRPWPRDPGCRRRLRPVDQKSEALEILARYIDRIVDPTATNVVCLPRRS